jgi:hypothetical protein
MDAQKSGWLEPDARISGSQCNTDPLPAALYDLSRSVAGKDNPNMTAVELAPEVWRRLRVGEKNMRLWLRNRTKSAECMLAEFAHKFSEVCTREESLTHWDLQPCRVALWQYASARALMFKDPGPDMIKVNYWHETGSDAVPGGSGHGACEACRGVFSESLLSIRQEFWKNLPVFFELVSTSFQ